MMYGHEHRDRYNGLEKVLKQTDTVSKQATKKFLVDADLLMLKVEEKFGFRSRDRLYELIRDMDKYELLSTQPKRGKWIKSGEWGRIYKCNQCGNFLDFDGVNAGRGSANFCPNCGAYMRGEE